MQDSNVVLVDKRRHFITLLLVCPLSGDESNMYRSSDNHAMPQPLHASTNSQPSLSPDESVTHREAFWLGWELNGDHNYSFHEGNVGTMSVEEENTPFVARHGTKRKHVMADGNAAGHNPGVEHCFA